MLARPIALLAAAAIVAVSVLAAASLTEPPRPASAAAPPAAPGSAGIAARATFAPGEPGTSGAIPRTTAPSTAAASSAEQDLMTYAFARVDVPALSAELIAVADAAARMGAAASGGSLAPTRESAERLSALAEAMVAHADAARSRMEPLHPADQTLAAVRRDALVCYEHLREQADAALEIAEFALTLDRDAAVAAARTIAALEAARANLESAHAAVLGALEGWSASHASQARRALGRYGVPAR